MSSLAFFWASLKSSMLSSGGFGNVPILHSELVSRRIVSQENFAEALAIGQVSPGPNGLWVICLGYFIGGTFDAVLALVSIAIPPLLVLPIRKIYETHRHNRGVEGFMLGLEIAVIGIFLSVMIGFLASAPKVVFTPIVAVVCFALTLTRRVPIPVIIVLAALAAYLFR
jgi:chromate transporter